MMRIGNAGRRVAGWRTVPAATALLVVAGLGQPLQAQLTGDDLVRALDEAAREHVDNELVAGASVAVVHRGETVLQRGYGYVDLEWSVRTPGDARASYEIGSITKQFTAAAAMVLVEEGRLNLEADFTDYVDFDTQGHAVSVRRLFDHTSGIKGYTEIERFDEFSMLDRPRDELLRMMERIPFEFDPGSAMIYNNTAYFLLGLIIEEVSGQPYEDFVRERLFEPAGMTDSYYCSESEIRERRAHGYDADDGRLVRKGYLDHTWPYAAGSLCSTVGDLVKWNQALHGGDLLAPGSYTVMTRPEPLADGTPLRYAGGLGIDDSSGRRVVSHGGGINGFLSDGRYYPDEDLIVVVLQNSAAPPGPGALSNSLVELVLGPPAERPSVPYRGELAELTGQYRGPGRGAEVTITIGEADGDLTVQMGEQDPRALSHRRGLEWAAGGLLLTFVREQGRIARAHFDTVGNHYVLERVEG